MLLGFSEAVKILTPGILSSFPYDVPAEEDTKSLNSSFKTAVFPPTVANSLNTVLIVAPVWL